MIFFVLCWNYLIFTKLKILLIHRFLFKQVKMKYINTEEAF